MNLNNDARFFFSTFWYYKSVFFPPQPSCSVNSLADGKRTIYGISSRRTKAKGKACNFFLKKLAVVYRWVEILLKLLRR